MINYLLVIGSVTAKQYSLARRDMRERDFVPTVKRLSHDEFCLRGVDTSLMRDCYNEASKQVRQLLRSSFVPVAVGSSIRIPFQSAIKASRMAGIDAAVRYNLEVRGISRVLSVVVHQTLRESGDASTVWEYWEAAFSRYTKWYVAHDSGWLETI